MVDEYIVDGRRYRVHEYVLDEEPKWCKKKKKKVEIQVLDQQINERY